MRYILPFTVLFFLYSCTTGQELISSGKIQKGLSKQDMRGKFMSSTLSEDPFLPEGGRLYFSETKTEIIYPSSKSYFYVFTTLHGFHLLGGLIYWYLTTKKVWITNQIAVNKAKQSIELCGIYWHFLLAVWIVLFGLMIFS